MSEEHLDILTPDGVPTGETKTKTDVHRDGDWHRVAHVWIVAPGRRVLLQRRSHRKENNPGRWDVSAAGHLAAGERDVDAGVREVCEELGIPIDVAELHRVARLSESRVLNRGTYLDNEIHEVFAVERDVEVSALVLQPGEVDDVRLVSFDDFRRRVAERDPALVPHWDEYALLARWISRDDSA